MLEKFKKASTHGVFYGDYLLVRRLEEEEVRTSSGIVLATGPKQAVPDDVISPIFAEVLEVGPGHYDDETKTSHPPDVEPGNIVMFAPNAVRFFRKFYNLKAAPMTIGLAQATDIIRKWDIDSFRKYFEELNHVG
jgi:co-chaperonin GroES (HSP10)